MPRKAPTQVIEHRITLGDYERKELKEALEINNTQTMIESGVTAGSAVLVGSAVVASTYIIYLGLKEIYGFVDEVTEPLKTIVFGKKTYPTKNPPPANPDDWVNRDPETGERINPMNPVPIAGGLTGLGIAIGEAVPVGSWIRSGWDSITS